jgi:enterochelin esterase-like enzyme
MPIRPVDTRRSRQRANGAKPSRSVPSSSEEADDLSLLHRRTGIKYFRQWLSSFRLKHLMPVLWSLPASLLAVIAGLLLFSSSLSTDLVSLFISLGLDPLRSQLVVALILTAAAALIGALLGRRRLAALIGAFCVFLIDYLLGFISLELQPMRDPGGLLEPLNGGALTRTSLIMAALSIASAFIGMAVGINLGEVLFAPFYQLAAYVGEHMVPRIAEPSRPLRRVVEKLSPRQLPRHEMPVSIVSKWLGAIGMIAVLILVANSVDLFIFSPDIGLHSAPVLKNGNAPAHGTVLEESFISLALNGQSRTFEIYLPPSYNTVQGQHKYYPTLYLLHGTPGHDIDWFTGGKIAESADTLIVSHKIPEMIIVCPDGNGRPKQTSEWGNSGDQKQLMENYVTNDLVNYIDQHYRTLPDPGDRAIGGLSEGGFGAVNIAIHHPNVFGSVISLGGYFVAEGTIWGNNIAYKRMNSPLYTLPATQAAWRLHFYLGAAAQDQPYYADTLQFAQELAKLHIPYQFDLEKGYHSWRVWQIQIYKAMSWLQWSST